MRFHPQGLAMTMHVRNKGYAHRKYKNRYDFEALQEKSTTEAVKQHWEVLRCHIAPVRFCGFL